MNAYTAGKADKEVQDRGIRIFELLSKEIEAVRGPSIGAQIRSDYQRAQVGLKLLDTFGLIVNVFDDGYDVGYEAKEDEYQEPVFTEMTDEEAVAAEAEFAGL